MRHDDSSWLLDHLFAATASWIERKSPRGASTPSRHVGDVLVPKVRGTMPMRVLDHDGRAALRRREAGAS
jgi:hypothetical protein